MALRLPSSWRVASRWLKRRAPATLFGRSLMIIVLPIALMQAAVTYAFFEAHWQTVTSRLSEGLAGDIAWAVESYKDDPSPESFARLSERAEESLGLSIALQPGRKIPEHRRDPPALIEPFFAPVDRSLERALSARLDDPYWFDTTRYPAYVDIRVAAPGGVMRVLAPRERAFATQGHIFVLWLTIATVLLTTVAILFIRNQVRAIERLAAAAEAFGRGGEDAKFKPHGAREVRQAARAFLDMRARIQRHIDQRTALLASVSHDLRTPLTRLKLALALAEPGARTADMKRDLAEMEHMIDEYLAFARGEAGRCLRRWRRTPGRWARPSRPRSMRRFRRLRDPWPCAARSAIWPRTPRRTAITWRWRRARSRTASRSPSMMTARAFRRPAGRRPSPPSPAWMRAATRTSKALAWASPSPATWPEATAATSRSRPRRWAACALCCGCRGRRAFTGGSARAGSVGTGRTERLACAASASGWRYGFWRLRRSPPIRSKASG
jgi:signal transduction histidine kinase